MTEVESNQDYDRLRHRCSGAQYLGGATPEKRLRGVALSLLAEISHEPILPSAKATSQDRGVKSITRIARQFTKFSLVGLSGGVVAFGVLNLCMGIWKNFPVANVLAFVVAVTWNFTLNRKFTFGRTSKPFFRQWLEFVTACLVGAALNWTVSMGLYYSFSFFREHFNYAAMAGVVFASTANFLSSRLYVFRNSPRPMSGETLTDSTLVTRKEALEK